MKYSGTLFICLLCLSCITITRVENRKDDDGSNSIVDSSRKYLTAFNVSDLNKRSEPNFFQYIDANGLKEIVRRNHYVIGVIWASWCPVSQMYLTKVSAWKDSLAKNYPEIELVLIEQNVNIGYSQKLLAKHGYSYMSYIIDPVLYGTDESHKQNNFFSLYNPDKKKNTGGVPNTFIMDSNGKIIYEVAGKEITLQFLLSKMK